MLFFKEGEVFLKAVINSDFVDSNVKHHNVYNNMKNDGTMCQMQNRNSFLTNCMCICMLLEHIVLDYI